MTKECIAYGLTRTIASLQCGGGKLVVDFSEPDFQNAIKYFSKSGLNVAVILLKNGILEPFPKIKDEKKSEWCKKLYQSLFFSTLQVIKKIGTDEEFIKWVRTQKCSRCGKEAPSEAAHVRRITNGAGTGIKPKYSVIPLCRECHAKQHQHGESSIASKEWFDKKRVFYMKSWAWAALKGKLEYDSWTNVPIEKFTKWVSENELDSYLSKE